MYVENVERGMKPLEQLEVLTHPQSWRTCRISSTRLARGPYREMARLTLTFHCSDRNPRSEHALSITVFAGRPPHYSAWAEVHDWDPQLYEKGVIGEALEILYKILPPGSRLYLEYTPHDATRRLLERGGEPSETPLGRLLLEKGYVKVADLYYPEGYREGGPKLLAYKP